MTLRASAQYLLNSSNQLKTKEYFRKKKLTWLHLMRSKLWFITILPLKTDRSLNKTNNYSLFLHKSGFLWLFYYLGSVETYLFFFLPSCPHSSLQVRSVQTQSHCCSVTDGSDAILFSRLSEWRGWRRQLSSGSVLSRTRAGDIGASLFGLVVGNIRYAQMGKGGESSISDSNIIAFRLWSGANSSILSAAWNNMWQSTHTGTTCTSNLKNTIQVTATGVWSIRNQKGNKWLVSLTRECVILM